MTAYSKKIGCIKSLKNLLVTFGLPALVYLVNGIGEWMPQDTATKIAPILAFVTYFAKNWKENKNNY